MKQLCIRIIIFISIALFLSLPCLGQESEVKKGTNTSFLKKQDRQIIISTASENHTLHYFQQKYIYQELFNRLGYDFHLIHQPAKRSILDANSGKVDGDAARVFHLNKNNQYPNLIRVSEFILKMNLVAFSHDPALAVNGWKSLSNKNFIVGYSHGYKIIETNLPKYVNKNNILVATNIEQGFQMMLAGRIDLFIDIQGFEESVFLKHTEISAHNIHNVGIIEVIVTYPYLHKKHLDIIEKLTSQLKMIKHEGSYQKLLESALQEFRRGKQQDG